MSNQQREVSNKIKKKKRKQTKKRILSGFFTFLFVSLIIFAILSVTVLFPIKEVSITGSNIYTPEQILDATDITTDTNLLVIREEKLAEKIREKLPFVDSIKIEREFPSKLNITAKDAKEEAAFKVGKEFYTVSKRGYVLNKYTEKPENIFEISVNKAEVNLGKMVSIEADDEKKALIEISEKLIKNEIKIDYIDVTDSLSLKAKVEGRFEVNFGTSMNIDKKVSHLKGMILQIDNKKTGKINLSMWTSEKTEGTFVEGDIK